MRRVRPTIERQFSNCRPTDADIAALAFTGRDTAAGRSWEAWMKKYAEKKAAGEKDLSLHPEMLE